MSVDAAGAVALAVVGLEWLGLGWLSGVRFPQPSAASLPAAEVERAATWSVRLLVGAWLVAVAQLLLATAGPGFGFIPGVLLVAAFAAVGVRLVVRRSAGRTGCSASADECAAHARLRERIGWLLLALVLVAALARSLLVPETGWDAFSHWGLRAQAFADAATIVDAHSEHEYYPPLVPLLEAWLYLHRGQVAIDLGKTLWALVGGAFAVCLGWHLRLSVRPSAAWIAPYAAGGIVLLTPELLDGFWTGQADLALTAYLSLATLAAWQWQRASEDRRWLLQAAIFGSATALTKFEGLPRIGLLCLALLIEAAVARRLWAARQTWLTLLSFVLPAAASWLVWTAFQLSHGIPANAEHLGPLQPLALGGVLVALVSVFVGLRAGGGLLVAAVSWLIALPKLGRPPLRALVLVVVAQAIGTLLAFLVSASPPEVEVQTSATRLVGQFMPLALLVGAIGLARIGHL